MNYLVSGQTPGRLGNAHPNIVPYQAFATVDGHLVLAVGNDGQFRSFCAVAGLPGLADDPRFARNADRVANRAALIAVIAPVLAGRSTPAWIAALEAAGVPCGPIHTIDQLFADPHAQARGLAQEMTRADGEAIQLVASPLRLSHTPPRLDAAPPLLGQDTRTALGELLGLLPAQLDALAEKRVI